MENHEQRQLLQQYKLFVEMADRVSERRLKTNQYYMTLLSGLLIITLFVMREEGRSIIGKYQAIIFFAIGLLGVIFCLIWQINIRSYRQLNTVKFKVIQEMERVLPYQAYTKEWELLGQGEDIKKYLQLTRIEKNVPFILILPYLLIIFFSILNMVSLV